tara:strand:+ start:232 stop:918 length:687 start_codon:yes stop_codon:yes gene_type:complete
MKNPERAIVNVSVCGIFAQPTFKSEMVNQALIKEKVTIIDKKDNWYKAYLNHDKYEGWIHEMYLDISNKNNQDLIDETYYIERFSKIPILDEAFKLLGKPYLWGGRSSQGYDCSGLIQTCSNLIGHELPRDAKDQVKSNLLLEVEMKNVCSGDLLFFEEDNFVNHVAIAISSFKRANKDLIYSGEMIHSSGTVKISNVVFDSELYAVVDNNHEKKIKLHKIMRFKSNE